MVVVVIGSGVVGDGVDGAGVAGIGDGSEWCCSLHSLHSTFAHDLYPV